MHRSSETIGAIATALAKAQGALGHPEKLPTATIRAGFPHNGDQTFRHTSVADGLDMIRKILGQHEIATIQSTTIDETSGQVRLTTLLAHSSGEWISSDWPVYAATEIAARYRIESALTYASRYSLFASMGIVGEDDFGTPNSLIDPSPSNPDVREADPTGRKPLRRPPVLDPERSLTLKNDLLAEISELTNGDELALWAYRRLPAKNSLSAGDALIVEQACQKLLDANLHFDPDRPSNSIAIPTVSTPAFEAGVPRSRTRKVTPLTKPIRHRSKAHLAFVGSQPCLICERAPCDAHHLKFAEPRALGRKVSDEFTVPLCRDHHNQLHRTGNERAWWADMQVSPLELANELWQKSPIHGSTI